MYRRALCLPVLGFLSFGISAQNLVPNPSFEDYSNCPTTGGTDGIGLAYPWYNVTNGTVDYYNTCSTLFSIPNRGQGDYQQSFSGNAYAGFWCYSPTVNNIREYLQAPLSNALVIGRKYHVKFYINACNVSACAINNIGINLSTDAISTSGSESLLSVPFSISKFGNPILSDTLQWISIEGVYTALGGESFVTIGNFIDDQGTDTEQMPNGTPSFPAAYYFVEDVSVEEITTPFWQYHDTTIYYGDSVLIGPAITGLDIDWYTANMGFISNSPGIYVTPATSRNFIAKETFNGTETTHVVHVTVIGGAGMDENELDGLLVYPNPSQGEIKISGHDLAGVFELTISDLSGKTVYTEKRAFTHSTESFYPKVQEGMYVLMLTNPETGASMQRRVLIQD